MILKKSVVGIALVLLLSVITVVMAEAPGITYDTQTPNNDTITVDYINVSVTLSSSGGIAILNWNGTNDSTPMTGSGTSFYTNKTGLSDGTYVFLVYANDSTNENWSVSPKRTVIVNTATSAPAIDSFNPTSSTFTSYAGTPVEFNVTSDQIVNVSWTINNVPAQTNISVPIGTKASYTNSTAGVGEYTVEANVSNANGSATTNWTWNVSTAPDTTPPASVTNLTLIGNGTTWLHINWTNPSDSDFNHVKIYKNTTLIHTTSSNTTNDYNITGLTSGTSYEINVTTLDSSNNENATAASITARTDNNTPATTNVVVNLENSTKVKFSTVTVSGNTASSVNNSAPPLPAGGYQAVGDYIDITTTAKFSGSIEVRVKYDPLLLPSNYQESDIRLYHWNGSTSQWDNITTGRDEPNNIVIGTVSSLSPFVTVIPPKPIITKVSPTTLDVQTIGSESKTFKITVNQTANVTWYLDNVSKLDSGSISANNEVNYTPPTQSSGNYNLSVKATNANGSDTVYWNWTVHSKTYETGNRVWDENKDMSLTYTWNPMSFYAFYYDLDGNVGNESLQVTLDTRSDRTIDKGDLTYTTTPQAVDFKYKKWGNYSVIGFMAQKYFAGYTTGTITDKSISTLSSKQLHKVITDDKTKRTVYVGSTLTLAEGYVLKVKDISADRQIILSLLKDGGEVDSDVVSEDTTYVYKKKVGSVNDLPIIAVHVSNIFAGAESSAVFIDGIFQISESYTSVNQDNKYGIMKVTSVYTNKIEMQNDNSLSLSAGTTSDVMGDIQIKVADNSSVLRFAPYVQKTGVYEVRGTISPNTETTPMWNPMNFEGFYYDLDEDVGSENISLTRHGRTIDENALVYTSTPQSVSFKHSDFGSYNVIGFMAQKYFAGYTSATKDITDGTPVSTISKQQLHKVLTDDDKKRPVYVGSTLTLSEGYVLKVTDISADRQIMISLLKDGTEVDTTVLSAGDTYVYSKKVGSVSDLPIIAVHVDAIFAGAEASAAFVKGIFQISENYTTVKTGDQFKIMKVTSVSDKQIQMKNTNTVSLDEGSDIDIMGKIKFKVADDTNSSVVRFYPYITVDSGVASANQLTVDAPANPMQKDTITITVTAGSGTAVEGAEVSFDNTVIGTTDSAGKVKYTLADSGLHNISATKLGYESDVKSIDVKEYIDTQLKFELPAIIDQGVPVIIKVTSGNNTIAGANITLDSTKIGTTDIRGELNYSFSVSGTHNLGASKTNYISVSRGIKIRMPFSEYKALDINLTPPVIFTGRETVIKANITNTGTKADDKQVELIINGTVVDNKSVALAPGDVKEINFTRKIELPKGNYTVEILGQKDVLRVDEKETSILLIGGILTGLGAILIFLFTSKKITIAAIKEFVTNLNAETIKEGLRNTGWKLKDALNELGGKFRK